MTKSPIQIAAAKKDHAPPKKEFDPWLIWVAFRRNWVWAFPVGLILAGLASAFVMNSFVPQYRATHLLAANTDYLVFKGVNPNLSNLSSSERTFIYNPIVLDPVLSDPEILAIPSLSNQATAHSTLMKNLQLGKGSTGFSVSYTADDPKDAALVCNTVVKYYLRAREQFDYKRISKLKSWIEPEVTNWENKVNERRKDLKELSKLTSGTQEFNFENDAHSANLSAMRSQIAEAKFQLTIDEALENNSASEREAKLDALRKAVTDGVVSETVERIVPTEFQIENLAQQDPDVRDANQQIKKYEAKMTQLADDPDRFGIRRDDYKFAEARVAEWTDYLAKAEEYARNQAAETLAELAEKQYQEDLENAGLSAEARLAKYEAKLASDQVARDQQKMKLQLLEERYDEEKAIQEEHGAATAALQFAKDELLIASDVLGKLRQRLIAIETENRLEGSVRSLSEATPPRKAVEPMPYKKLGMAGLVALLIPFGLGFLWEFRTQRVTDSTMCSKQGISVIGEIARLPSGGKTSRGRRVFEESVDSLRASLFLSIDTRETRSIAVASSMSGEGKSSVSSQLALSIAKATGETVLLVDADLRCPDQHDIFGIDIGPGLSGVLSGKATLQEATNRSLGDRIHVLPAGPLTGSPHRLLSVEKMRVFIDEALKEYQYVVVDTAPVLSAGESLAVASTVDATLLCVMRDLSRMENVTRTTRRLEAVGATIAGTVFSGVTPRQYAYRYGDYHYSSPEANITHAS